MTCVVCKLIGQFLLNFLNLADHFANFLLLGDADETVSARTARARNAGKHWASKLCDFLSFATRIVTFGKVDHDHCAMALDKTIRPNSREIWNWDTCSLNQTPLSEVEVVDVGEDSNNPVE